MATYDAEGHSTDPEDEGGINPTHPNYISDPRWAPYRRRWARDHAVELGEQAEEKTP